MSVTSTVKRNLYIKFFFDHESQRIHMYQCFLNIPRVLLMSFPEAAVCKSNVRIGDAAGLVIPNCKLKLAEISSKIQRFCTQCGRLGSA